QSGVMKKHLNLTDVINLLAAACEECGSQKAFADTHNISAQYVSDVMKRKREPGDAILRALGLRKVAMYEMMPFIRVERRTGKIEFKRSNGLWYPMPQEWTFDRKAREFVYRQGTNRETRYKLSQKQTDAEYLHGALPISANGEILISEG